MKALFPRFPVILLLFFATNVFAATYYVDVNSSNPTPPFTHWSTAATNIQDAIDASIDGDLILVTNGVYAYGGHVIYGTTPDLVAINKAVTVASVNGPTVTVITGNGSARCAYLTNNAVLTGFTITGGITDYSGDANTVRAGAGAFCESSSSTVSNCTIAFNGAALNGGGTFGGTILNCLITSNAAPFGGGAYSSTLQNCLVVYNVASPNAGAGGVEGGIANNCTIAGNYSGAINTALYNCIIYYNTNGNTSGVTATNCCTMPDPGGAANIIADPQLADIGHISATSPCRGAGNPLFTSGVDIDGDAWLNPPSIGCDEYVPGNITGPLSAQAYAQYANVSTGFTQSFNADVSGHANLNTWDFGDGTVVSNSLVTSHAWQIPGTYNVTFTIYNETYPAGISSTVAVNVVNETYYVNANNPNPIPPYTSWATAATNIQDAVDAVIGPGSTVLVSNGVYQAGGHAVNGALTNRVAITTPITLQSVNGPASTVIVGNHVPGTIFGSNAVRCVYLTNRSALIGFTLTNGATLASGIGYYEQSGAGVLALSSDSIISNCVIVANYASGADTRGGAGGDGGGGVRGGTLYNCVIIGNSATNSGDGGGAMSSILTNCVLAGNSGGFGGGGYICTAHGCWITNNTAGAGGGMYDTYFTGLLDDCLVSGNSSGAGSGLYGCQAVNCTVVRNFSGTGLFAGGAFDSSAANCIFYYNTNSDGTQVNYSTGSYNYCCTTPVPGSETGCFSDPPLFVNQATGDFHLLSNSPCINSGDNSSVTSTTDLDGNPRIVANYVDVGAFEYQSASLPTAAIQAPYTNLLTGYAAPFTALLSWGRANSANWDFGDGTTISNTLTPTHIYTLPGQYTVTAQVYTLNISNPFVATITVNVATQAFYYVNSASLNATPPYSSWNTAASNIQDAIDIATPATNAFVVVTNGVYQTGGRVVYGSLTNRVVVNKPIVVESVNGPSVTFIQGYKAPGTNNGDVAIRGVYLTNNASLIGFTVIGCGTRAAGDNTHEQRGGGIFCESTTAMISQCVVLSNSAAVEGGGAFSGTFNGCAFNGNTAVNNGGGASSSTLNNCTLWGNFAGSTGGGVYSANLTNSIVYYNNAPAGSNYAFGSQAYCCTAPLTNGAGNITSEPLLTDLSHISGNSPCRGAGNFAATAGTDIDGEPWLNPPSIGCDEFYAETINSPLSVITQADYTNTATGFPVNLSGIISGHAEISFWNFGDGTFATNRPVLSHSWTVAGDYAVVLTATNDSFPTGVSAALTVHVVANPIHYVSQAGTNPIAPYLSWDTAATNIQDAVDASYGGATVLVSNGVYKSAGRVVYGSSTNCVALNKRGLTLQSVNGASATMIQGSSTMRCLYATNNTAVIGFTLSNGVTRNSGDTAREQSGGAIWCESTNCLFINCVAVSNSATQLGGGAFLGSCSNCVFAGNSAASGGGTFGGALFSCTLSNNSASTGGGAFSNLLNNCSLTANKASNNGGGAAGSILNGCRVSWNTNTLTGGGINNCTATSCTISNNFGNGAANSHITNCIVVGNSANHGGGLNGGVASGCTITGNSGSDSIGSGGAFSSTLYNCVLVGNTALIGPGNAGSSCTFNNCIIASNSVGSIPVVDSTLNNCVVIGHTNQYATYGCTLRNSTIYYNRSNYFISFGSISFCCTTPLPSGLGNFTNAPLFVNTAAGDFHLLSNSPCINSGNNSYMTNSTDLDGNPRIVGGTVDIGPYEFQSPASVISYAWLQQYGLPTDGSVDYADLDGTSFNVYQDWIAGLNPTNAASVLVMQTPRATTNSTGVIVTWLSVNNRTYYLQQATNLAVQPAFSTIKSNITGQAGTTSFTDTTATNGGPYFYRVGVQH